MSNFNVPTRDEVSENNQAIFDNLERVLDLFLTFMPQWDIKNWVVTCNFWGCNLIKQQRKEVVNLAVSQLNGCKYCQAAHTATGKMNGFTDDQIIELRRRSKLG
jgi:AhpD family alkylhydroperoxidase